MSSDPPHLNVLNQLLGGGVDRGLGVSHILNGAGPPGGLVEQLGVEPIAVLPSVHGDVPVACNSSIAHTSVLTCDQRDVLALQSQKASTIGSLWHSHLSPFNSYLVQ